MANLNQSFPQELVDLVIDHAFDDKETLKALALVHTSWLPTSRHHLFSELDISHENARELIQLLASPRCTFTAQVHRINVHLVPGSQRWFLEFSRRLSVLNTTSITTLGLVGTRSTFVHKEVRSAIITFFPQIQQLDIGIVILESPAFLIELLSELEHLETFCSSANFQANTQASTGPDALSNIPLRRLNLSAPSMSPLLGYFLDRGILSQLLHLSLSSMAAADLATLERFMSSPNNTLQSLHLTMDANFMGVGVVEFTERVSSNLGQLTSLRTLNIVTHPPLLATST